VISLPKLHHIVAVMWAVESSCDPGDGCTSTKQLTASTAKLRLKQVTGMARTSLWRRSSVSRKGIKEAILLIVKPASLEAQQAVGTRSYATKKSAGFWLSVSRPRSNMRLWLRGEICGVTSPHGGESRLACSRARFLLASSFRRSPSRIP